MIPHRDAEYLAGLVGTLRQLPRETEWVEFKVNQATEPQTIGEYISALANGAALNGKESAYLLWGIMVSIFDTRIEIANPGEPRFLRNVSLMRSPSHAMKGWRV